MKINTQFPLKVLLLSLIFILHPGCSKDFDLLADYVLTNTGKNVVDDTFMVSQNRSIVLDVLSNDGYTEQDNVSIMETSAPTSGSVVINTNNTITYTPSTVEEPPVTAEEPPVTAEEPPIAAEEPPVAVEEPPVAVEEPPVAVEEPPVTVEEPPVTAEEPSVEAEEPPVTVDTFTYTTEVVNEDESVTTEEGTVTVVITPENQAPTAVATANILTGDAPLLVDFSGESSSDDNNIVSYYWNFPGNSSSAPNATHTFNDPGVYDVTLTVADDAGLEDTATLTITVGQESLVGQIPCGTGGGTAGQTGAKIWCWGGVNDVPTYNGISSTFQNGQLALHSECNPNQVTKVGDKLRFYLNPKTPAPQEWCNNIHNMRAEVTTNPWEINHPKGTEEWLGWSYTFGDDYAVDTTAPWLFYQVHHGVIGDSPHLELLVGTNGLYGGSAGEIIVKNAANNNDFLPTGVIPKAGETVDIVVHAVWGDASNGLLQVWINGNQVYNKQVRTVYSHHEYGGNSKFGIYKWYWRDASGVNNSAAIGINSVTTYMGPLRMITRSPGGADYLKDSYNEVAPD